MLLFQFLAPAPPPCAALPLLLPGCGGLSDSDKLDLILDILQNNVLPMLANLDAAVSDVPADVLAAAQAAPIHADVKRMNGAQVQGDGTANNKWRGNV